MKDSFTRYMLSFLKRNSVVLEDIDLNGINDGAAMLNYFNKERIDLSGIDNMNTFIFNLGIVFDLRSKGICLYDDYKKSSNYAQLKDEVIIAGDYGLVSIENYIERFLLDSSELLDVYVSIYEMGNLYELDDDECRYEAISEAIIDELKLKDNDGGRKDPNEIINSFIRKDDSYIVQLKKHLGFDLELFDDNDVQNRHEQAKILYFLYMLKNKHFPTNILQLFDKPSMENIDNSFLGWRTSNGDIVRFVKNALMQELSLPAYGDIEREIADTMRLIVSSWDKLIEDANKFIYHLNENQCRNFFGRCTGVLESIMLYVDHGNETCRPSPIATLYLKVLQHEYIGNVLDIKEYINTSQPNTDYFVPSELVGEMKTLSLNEVNIDDLENYFEKNENTRRIARYVYYKKSEVSKYDRKNMKEHIWKIPIIIELCLRARPLIDKRDMSNELFVVSCLQAILIDKGNKDFNYTFYGHQRDDANKTPNIQAIPRATEPIVDAAHVYWSHKVSNRWDANVGLCEARKPIREFESSCDNILLKILERPTIDGMVAVHNYYMPQIEALLNMVYVEADVAKNDNLGSGFKKMRT